MDFRDLDQLIEAHGASLVIERVVPYLTSARIERIENVLTGRLDSLHVIFWIYKKETTRLSRLF